MKATLALDMATTTGWAVHVGGPGEPLIVSGIKNIAPSRFQHAGARYQKLRNLLIDTRAKFDLGLIAFEHPIAHHSGSEAAAFAYGYLSLIQMYCADYKIPYRSAYPVTIKKFFTGVGNAKKEAMIEECRSRGFSPIDDNEADALAILHWATQENFKEGTFDTPF